MNRYKAFAPRLPLGDEDLRVVANWYASYHGDGRKPKSVAEMVGEFAWIAVSNLLMTEAERQDEQGETDA
jgi:hypothetical protein